MAEKTVPEIKPETPAVKREITRNPENFTSPAVDIFETDSGLTLVADLPGVDKAGLKIRVEEGVLTIEGRVDPLPLAGVLLQEFKPSSFFRQFELTDTIDQEQISAELKNGVLTLSLPKSEAAKPRQINVSVS